MDLTVTTGVNKKKRPSKRKQGDSPPKKKKKDFGARTDKWIVVINNPTEEEKATYWDAPEDWMKINRLQYWLIAQETAPDTGTPHFQCYAIFELRKQFTTVKKIFPRAHLETQVDYASVKNNQDYCKKDGLFREFGTLPDNVQSKHAQQKEAKAKFAEAAELAIAGKIQAIREADVGLYARGIRTWSLLAQMHAPIPDDRDVILDEWIWGPTGLGKSKLARTENPRETMYLKGLNKWWDGYDQNYHTWVLIEDFPKMPPIEMINNMKIWCDHYAFRVEVKGGGFTIRPKKIVVTSNYSIEECFDRQQDHLPLLRRFKVRNLIQPFINDD
ncbi:replication-associated protein [Crucivirus-538]|nr:replication-associated protein [Crucivirus-538]